MLGPKTFGASALSSATSHCVSAVIRESLPPRCLVQPRRSSVCLPSRSGHRSRHSPHSRGLWGGLLGEPKHRERDRSAVSSNNHLHHTVPQTQVYARQRKGSLLSSHWGRAPAEVPFRDPLFGKQKSGYFSLPGPLKLGDVVKLPLLQRNTREEVAKIWLSHFFSKPQRHAATLTGAQYDTLEKNARNAPIFIVPLPKGFGAFETLVTQFQRNCCLITSLEQYKQNATTASPLMTLTFYPELMSTHNLVLVKGDMFSPILRPPDGAHVTRVIIESYTDINRFQWVQTFNMSPGEFNFEQFREANPDFFAFPLPETQPVNGQKVGDTLLWLT